MNKTLSRNIKTATVLFSLFSLVSCGGGGGSSNTETATPETLTGVLTAPGGTIALKQPTVLDQVIAALVGKKAVAALEGVSAVGSEVVELIRVDGNGDQQGAVIASGTSAADGSFSIDLPNGFVLEANMVIRGGGQIEARPDKTKGVNVNPVSHAASQLIVDNGIDLSQLTVKEVAEINDAVDGIAQNVEGLSGTLSDYTNALKAEATNNEETIAIVNNTDATGSICGTVTDSSSNPLENIRVVVKTFSNPVTVSKIKTSADGNYYLNLEDGQYIVAAYNFTSTSTAASEWYTASSPTGAGGTSQFDADPLTVSGTTPVTADFELQPGARISGNVLAAAGGALAEGTPMEGVRAQLRQFDSFIPLVSARVKADGSYVMNVPAGKYVLQARNKTRFPYASQFHDNASGSPTRTNVQPISLATGDAVVKDFNLKPGVKISGIVMDAPLASGGVPVPGIRVRIDMITSPGGPAARLRTNKLGQYRVWLEDTYSYGVVSRGQSNSTSDPFTSNEIIDFDAEMLKVQANVTVGASGPAVREAKIIINDQDPLSNQFSQEITNASGDVEMYVPIAGCADCRLRAAIDSGRFIGSEYYLNKHDGTYNSIIIPAGSRNSVNDLGNWPLVEGGLLQGTAYTDSSKTTVEPNIRVRARLIGTGFFVNTRTRADGTYSLSLPPGTYAKIRFEHGAGSIDYDGTVAITANQVTDLDSNP